MSMSLSLEQLCRALPKVEIHSHLHGSVRDETLKQLIEAHKEGQDKDQALSLLSSRSRTLEDCFSIFGLIHELVVRKETVAQIAREMIEDCQNDNVKYLEIRTTPRKLRDAEKRDYVDTVLNVVEAANHEGKGEFFVRLLLSVDRRGSVAEAMETVEIAKEWRDRGIVGLDFCGNPTIGVFDDFEDVFRTARGHGLKITVHTAEIPHQKDTAAVLKFRPERLGHACCLTEEEAELVLRHNIAVEACPTSNVLCGSVSEYGLHPFGRWFLEANHPCTICTDDSGVFRVTLSHEIEQLGKAFQLSSENLKAFSLASIDPIFSDDLKEPLRRQFTSMLERLN